MANLPIYYYPVVGRKSTGAIFDRISIEDMQQNHRHQFTLFILGYAAIQGIHDPRSGGYQPVPPAASYMEIAGIHGKPYREYAGDRKMPEQKIADYDPADPKDTLPIPSRFGGYCNHGSVSFPTWHRPYVMLVEQAIGDVADRLAADIERENPKEVGLWVPEARKLRFPYWDWAEERVIVEGFPPVIVDDTVEILLPGGRTASVRNPLSYYSYQGGIPPDFENEETRSGTAYFSQWTRSFRHSPSDPNGSTDNEALQAAIIGERAENIRRQLGLLFNIPDGEDPARTWDEFSNTVNESRSDLNQRNTGSLESVHGLIHGAVGGNGHMATPDYAAYDPFFFLHHSNVDRIIALWEWCYRDYWMEDGYTDPRTGRFAAWTQERGTYSQVYNEQILPTGARGALYPFRLENGEYWNSEQAHFLDADSYPKYYSYDEFLGIKVDRQATPEERRAARRRIYDYYGYNPGEAATKTNKASWTHVPVRSAKEAGLPELFKEISNFRIFIVVVRLPEHAFNRSYNFELHYNHDTESRFIGAVTVFARPDHSPCKACAKRRASGSVIRGAIPLPFSLVNDIVVRSRAGRTNSTLETTTTDITKCLSGVLVDTAGKVLATARGGSEAPRVPDEESASDTVVPAEVALYTSAAAEKTDDKKHPVQLFDWQAHNALFPNGWKAEDQEASS
ncbi:common central domain of tyrosinase-domain-containing protein [Pisolithus thermaeus]|nr:common central domain of tyrosinase-domain-containing protein [Pisolithus croceorrhizus]KAI6137186.1 common central domain of tyrosinase-domain-containing protein [Pisolithus sp. B1]KAI6159918.1 common central domain of tyrosinase-domain-containing protein [Pisolithus thermaeus]